MEFKPVLRFGVMSDLHYHEERPICRDRFTSALNTMYSYAESQKYNKVDALYIVGDFSDTGTYEQMRMLKEDCDKLLKDETLLALTLANHELHYGESEQKALEFFNEIFALPVDRHEVLKGFHFISVTTTNDGGEWHDSFDDEKCKFLKTELKKAAEKTPDKPIFVFQHPGVYNTTPGAAFGNLWIYDILEAYPNVVNFSGHSHVAANDPRETHQRDFTAVSTGSLQTISTARDWLYRELGGIGYKVADYAQMLIVEVNEEGKIRIKYVDVIAKKLFPEERIIDISKGKEGFVYTSDRTAPVPVFSVSARASLMVDGENIRIKFSAAEGSVWYYNLKLFDSEENLVKEENIPAHFASAIPKPEYDITLPLEEKTPLFAEVKAVGFFGNVSNPITSK